MDLKAIQEMANSINENWDSLKLLKREYIYESDFYRMIESAYLLAKASV